MLCLYLVALFYLPSSASAVTLNELIVLIQSSYENTSDIQASFLQESFIKTMGTIKKAEGRLYIKKPGRMLWSYKKPDRQDILITGNDVLIYKYEERQVIRSHLGLEKTPATFLAGMGRLRDDFNISYAVRDCNKEGYYHLELIPKAKGSITRVLLEIRAWKGYKNEDKVRYITSGFTLTDIIGNTTKIVLKNVEINRGIKDSVFQVKIPEGAEIIEQ
ncbi:MAG: outer membrane lipoprotein carrier protein LolA [Nitrospirota bacterium]